MVDTYRSRAGDGGAPATVGSTRKPPAAGAPQHAVVARTAAAPELFQLGNRVQTPALDVARLREEDRQAGFGPLRMGVVQELDSAQTAAGIWIDTADGGWIWTLAIEARGARAVRLRISDWSPPPGAELIIYDARNPQLALGPLHPLGVREYWTPTIYSDEVHIEYYVPAGVDHDAPDVQPALDGLLNQYRRGPGDDGDGPQIAELSCHLDVTCYPDWQLEADGVGALSFVANPFGFFCSGAMLSRVPEDFTSLFMTARHCGVNESNAASLLVTWFFQTATCDGTPANPFFLPQSQGRVLLVNDANTDFTLVGMLDSNTAGVTYVGWTEASWPNVQLAVGIHHPGGKHKRITFGVKDDTGDSCVDGASWLTSNPDGQGEIEPGSSGSPIFDSAHRVRGTASCANWGCGQNNGAEYGRLDVAYLKLAPYLNPTDPIFVNAAHGGAERGTSSEPFNTVLEGVFAVIRGSDVFIQAGNYADRGRFEKGMRLHATNGVVRLGN